jgi:ribonuclease P protein component
MLPSSKRLSVALFKEVMDKGKHMHSPLFALRAIKTEGLSRFSVSVPKKVAKTAVLRNKLRRRMYSALTPLFSEIKEGIHGVFIVKEALRKATFEEISLELRQFFGKSGLLK